MIIVCLLAIPILMLDSYSEEITRSDINKLKGEITNSNKKIISLEVKMEKQKIIIVDYEIKFETLKDELKTLKKNSNNSWDSLKKIIDTEKKLRESEEKLKESKKKLQLLRIEQSSIIRLIDDLDKKLDEMIISLRKKVSEKEIIQQEDEKINSFNSTGLVKKIGIKLSSSCIQLIKNNFTTTCPTYEELYKLDSSVQNISGEFGYKDGYFQRLDSNYINSRNWYDFDNQLRIFVDPPVSMQSHIKMVKIESNFDTYLLNGKNYQSAKYEDKNIEVINHFNKTKIITLKVKTQEQGQIIYHDRYIDDYCKMSIISSDNWKELLDDTIKHMRQNCDEGTTIFNNTEFIPAIKTEFDITKSPSWQALQWFEKAKIECKNLCLGQD